MTKFSQSLSKAVESTGLSLRKVSERVGIVPSFLSKLSTGAAAPSDNALKTLCERMAPDWIAELDHDWSKELLVAHLEDCAAASGLDLTHLQISLDGSQDHRFTEFPPSLSDTLYTLGQTAKADKEFAKMLETFEGMALRLQARLHDEQQTARRAQVTK